MRQNKGIYFYPEALRKRVVNYVERGRGTAVESSKLYKVSFKSVYNWIEQKREKGSLKSNSPSSTRRHKINKEDLKKYVQKHPGHYLREIAVAFNVSSGAIFQALKSMKLTLKKTLLYKERDENRRKEFQERIKFIAKDRLLLMNESGIDTFAFRKLRRSLRGEKIDGEVSGKRYARQSFIAAKVWITNYSYNDC